MLPSPVKILLGPVLAFISALLTATPLAAEPFGLAVTRGADGAVTLRWDIAPGNYLYKDKIGVTGQQGRVIRIVTPAGETKDDPTFGPTEIYRGQLSVALAAAELRGERRVLVSYQGCSEKGVCFPPQIAAVDLDTLTTATASPRAAVGLPLSDNGNGSESSAGQGEAQAAGALSGPLPIVLISFLGLGILLAFTPCVLPMIPIVVGIVVGSDRPASWRRGAFLSATYALGMAIAYASLGAVAAWSGDNLQLALQTPPMISLAAAVFVALALSSFGVFDLQLPARWLAKGNSGTKATGGFFGAAILGFTSALIVGPCVTPPLAAALLYVTQDGDAIRGAAALFALGLGMGIPVVLAGTFGNRVLPKSGPWLLQVRRLFGVVFLALAIFMLGRVVPPNVTLGLWGALGIGLAIFLGATDRPRLPTNLAAKLAKAAGVIALIYGSTLIVGFAGGADDPLRPLAFLRAVPQQTRLEPEFHTRVTTSSALDDALHRARDSRRPVLIEFTADWCATCKSIEKTVFADPAVRARLESVSVIRADVTRSSADTAELMRRYGVVGPPTLIFLRPGDGGEVTGSRSIGELTVEQMLQRLNFKPLNLS